MKIRRRAVGVAFALTGVPLGMYFNYMLPTLQWSPVFMLLSVVLITHYSSLMQGRISTFSQVFVLLTTYQFLMIFYGLLSDEMTTQLLSFHLFAIALIISLSSKRLTDKELEDSIYWTYIFSGICTLLGAYFLWSGLIIGEEAWRLRNENEDYALEIFTASIAAIINLACVLYYPKDRNKFFSFLRYPMGIACLYIIIFGGKRTPMLVTLAIILFFIVKQKQINKAKLYLTSLAAMLALVFLYIGNDMIQDNVNDSLYNIYFGIQNIFGNINTTDKTGSASIRVDSRNWAYSYIAENFNILNFIFGAGYMTRWLDNPILQAYLDMGILGFFGYILIVVAYPIRVAFKSDRSNTTMFALSLCTYGALSSISSGTPYMYLKYTPIIILSSFISSSKFNLERSQVAESNV